MAMSEDMMVGLINVEVEGMTVTVRRALGGTTNTTEGKRQPSLYPTQK